MTLDTYEVLKTFCDLRGPVGRETIIQQKVREIISEFCSDISQDKIGNISATMKGKMGSYAIVAHADEVGFLVSGMSEEGFIHTKWNTTGHIPDLRLLPGQRVHIITDSGLVPGCFAVKTAHIAGPVEKKKLPKYEEIFLDVGADSIDSIKEMGIHVGDPIVYASSLEKIGKRAIGKSIDNRIGISMMLIIAERLAKLPEAKRPAVVFISTVMEEMGAKGAAAIAKDLDMDGVIIAEVGLADDYPGTSGEAGVALGKGPVVVIKDTQIHYSHEQNKKIFAIADEKKIEIQRAVYHNYATDGFQIAAQGERVSVIGVPCRYTHSSFEMIDLDDMKSAIDLIYDVITR
jgi:putative aminopeptidase FrvX